MQSKQQAQHATRSIRWYDFIGSIYQRITLNDYGYREARQEAIERLDVHADDVVFDVFCGTGVNIEPLAMHLGPGGMVVGVDGSAVMLERARNVAEGLQGDVPPIRFISIDLATDDGRARLRDLISEFHPRKFLFTLGLTCIESWRELTQAAVEAAPTGSTFVIMDVYSEHLTLGARLINWVGSADCTRPVWKGLEACASAFGKREFKPFRLVNVSWGNKA